MLKRVWESTSHKLSSSTTHDTCNCSAYITQHCYLCYCGNYLCTIRHAAVLVLPSPYMSREQFIRRQTRMRRREQYERAVQIAQIEETKRVNEQNKYHGKLHWCRSFSDEWELQTSSTYLSQLQPLQQEMTSSTMCENDNEHKEENTKVNFTCVQHSHQFDQEGQLHEMNWLQSRHDNEVYSTKNNQALNTMKTVMETPSEVQYLRFIETEVNNLSSQLTVLDKLATLQGRLLRISPQRQHLV